MTDPGSLGANVLTGPAAFIAAILWAGYLVLREIGKLRAQDYAGLEVRLKEVEAKLDQANVTISQIKEAHMEQQNQTQARLVRARAMLVDAGVLPEDLP